MREELAKFAGLRRRFKGTFVKFGSKSGYKGSVTTMLLKDLVDVQTGKIVTDHLWFTLTKGFASMNLQEGDVLCFDARVTRYLKGYRGRREEDECNFKPLEHDWRLVFPTKIEKIPQPQPAKHVNLGGEAKAEATSASYECMVRNKSQRTLAEFSELTK